MPSYRLNDPRQGLIGPVRLETVRDLVSAGVIQDDVLISKDGSDWLPVAQFAEVIGQPEPVSERKAAYAGDLGKHSFFKVFYRFYLAQAHGLLTVKDAPRQKDIYLEGGRPIFVASNVDSERLGAFLARHGKLDDDDLKVALNAMATDNNHLDKTLVRLGLMDAGDVQRAIAGQQIERLIDLCRWRVGQYVFFEGARYLGEKLELGIVPSHLIMAAALSMDGPTLSERLRPYVDAAVRLDHPEYSYDMPQLTPAQQHALAQIDGVHTVAEIVKQFTDTPSRKEALALMYMLWEIDGLSFVAHR